MMFMLKYQDEHGKAPTLREIVEAVPALNWRSSARDVLMRLKKRGKVEERGAVNCARRFWALRS